MKVVKYMKYGSPDVLKVEEVEKPAPKNNEVLVKICAASVTAADTMMRRGNPYIGRLFIGLTKPKYSVIGTGFAGDVEAVGKDVTQFTVGDAVFGESIFGSGTNAEYVCVPEEGVLVRKPSNVSYEEACPACDGAVTSLNFLRDVGKIQKGQRVLVVGASGSLGSAAVQIARGMGAKVTGVCSSSNAEWVKSLGAEAVIDYTAEDFTKNGQTYDIVYDTLGKHSFMHCKSSLSKNGVYLSPVFGIGNLLQMLWTSVIGGKKAKFSATGLRPIQELRELLAEVKSLLESKKIKSIIDKQYPLVEAAAAHAYVDKGHKKGNVVISI